MREALVGCVTDHHAFMLQELLRHIEFLDQQIARFDVRIEARTRPFAAALEIERIVHEAPTFIGDTIYSESTVLATHASSQGDRGVVRVETRVTNQRGERVMTFRRTALIPKRNHPSLGEGRLPA